MHNELLLAGFMDFSLLAVVHGYVTSDGLDRLRTVLDNQRLNFFDDLGLGFFGDFVDLLDLDLFNRFLQNRQLLLMYDLLDLLNRRL